MINIDKVKQWISTGYLTAASTVGLLEESNATDDEWRVILGYLNEHNSKEAGV